MYRFSIIFLLYFLMPAITAHTNTNNFVPDMHKAYLYDFSTYSNKELHTYLDFAIVNVGRLEKTDIPAVEVQLHIFNRQISAIYTELERRRGIK